jgi:hypothetical protein
MSYDLSYQGYMNSNTMNSDEQETPYSWPDFAAQLPKSADVAQGGATTYSPENHKDSSHIQAEPFLAPASYLAEYPYPPIVSRKRRTINISIPVLLILLVALLTAGGIATWASIASIAPKAVDSPEGVARRFLTAWRENSEEKMHATLHREMRDGLKGIATGGVLKVVRFSCLEARDPKYETTQTGDNNAIVQVSATLECSPGINIPVIDVRAGVTISRPFALTLNTVKEGSYWYIAGISTNFNP